MLLFRQTMISAEYIWLGGRDTYGDLRAKTRTLYLGEKVRSFMADISEQEEDIRYWDLNSICRDFEGNGEEKTLVSYIPEWNFDGSSTGQVSSEGDTEIVIKPCAVCIDPFRKSPNILVLCDCYLPNGEPHGSNTRWEAAKIFEKYKEESSWFGLEQEYFLSNVLGTSGNTLRASTDFYCGNGAGKIPARGLMEEHYQKCLYAYIKISGYNAEVMPGQYEYQIGPVEGIQAADQLVFARFIMTRLCEEMDIVVNYDPKPIEDGNGSGLHHNFSTRDMRGEGGYKHILDACRKLKAKHEEHLLIYGEDNELRLTGKHETSSMTDFTWGVGTRNTSVRIPNQTYSLQRGYLEDRRPAANVDPYLSTAKLLLTCVE